MPKVLIDARSSGSSRGNDMQNLVSVWLILLIAIVSIRAACAYRFCTTIAKREFCVKAGPPAAVCFAEGPALKGLEEHSV